MLLLRACLVEEEGLRDAVGGQRPSVSVALRRVCPIAGVAVVRMAVAAVSVRLLVAEELRNIEVVVVAVAVGVFHGNQKAAVAAVEAPHSNR